MIGKDNGNRCQQLKAQVRQQAIEWQTRFANKNLSYLELAEWTEHFYKLGKRYGLIKEFKENGIL